MDTTRFIQNEHGKFRLKVWLADDAWLWSVCVHTAFGGGWGWKQLSQGFNYLPDVAKRNGKAALKALAETGVKV